MSDIVILPMPGIGTLSLSREQFEAALVDGARLAGPVVAPSEEPLLTADQIAEKLQIPPSWMEAAGRDGRVPSIECGRWRRFRRSAVEAALAANTGAKP